MLAVRSTAPRDLQPSAVLLALCMDPREHLLRRRIAERHPAQVEHGTPRRVPVQMLGGTDVARWSEALLQIVWAAITSRISIYSDAPARP